MPSDDTGTAEAHNTKPVGPTVRKAYLVCIHPRGSVPGPVHEIGPTPAVIGRATGCEVRHEHESVSRRHARVAREPGGWYAVADLGSTNGTFVNGTRVTASARLGDGDYVRVGGCVYRFLLGENVEAVYHQEAYRLAVLDPLTGAYNRRFLDDALGHAVAAAARRRRPLAAALVDVDHFKAINDAHGHPAGDAVLAQLAACLAATVRREEVLARYGGEEFAVMLPETDLGGGRLFAERVRRAIERESFLIAGRRHRVTVSVGVGALEAGEPGGAAALLARADRKLYEAKQSGRNRVC